MRRLLTPFKTHTNHTNEMIDANHLNEVQQAINEVESDLYQTKSENFVQLSLMTLTNHPKANAVQFLDDKNQYKIASTFATSHPSFISDSKGLRLTEGLLSANLRTETLSGHLPQSLLNHFSVLLDADIPIGAVLKLYLVINDGQEVYDLENTITLEEAIEDYQIMIYMKANQAGESPLLYQAHIYFEDEKVTASLGGLI